MKATSLSNIKIVILWGISFLCGTVIAQSEISIDKITTEKAALNFWIKVLENGTLKDSLKKSDFKILKQGTEDVSLEVFYRENGTIYSDNESDVRQSTILFLLDLSKEIDEGELASAKKMIIRIIRERTDNSNTDFLLTAFNSTAHVERIQIDINNADKILSSLKLEEKEPDFFRILMNEIRYLKGLSGNKSMFVFASGSNKADSDIYNKQLPFTYEDIENLVASLPFNFRFFVVALDEENERIENFTCLRHEGATRIYNGSYPEDYPKILGNNKKALSNYLIKAIPENPDFKGKKRTYIVQYNGIEASKDFRRGSINFPVNIQRKVDLIDWVILLALGMISILLILGVGSLIVPAIREKNFIKKYVKKYVPESNVVKYDLYYNDPIAPGEQVVTKCRQVTPFSSWKENEWQCPNYPICLDQNCNGSGAPVSNSFFSMEGIYLKLNWILFGAIGGFIAWIIITLFRMTNFQALNKLIGDLVGQDFLKSISKDNPELITQTIGNNLLVGIAFGTGLLLMLSWMEERRASNRYSFVRSWMRISLRTFAGTLISIIVFFAGFYLQYLLGVSPYLSGLISWLFFGLGLGIIMSVYSSISAMNGIIGGTLAAVIAFQVYFGLSDFLKVDFLIANLISMILMGGLIGSILVSVVTSLEDYELDVIAPSGYQRSIPISKWLKSNVGVMIGKSPGCYVYIKWEDDDVRPEHAELFTEEGNVFLRPIEEVLLDGSLISKPTILKNGSTIQLGRSSITRFRFIEK